MTPWDRAPLARIEIAPGAPTARGPRRLLVLLIMAVLCAGCPDSRPNPPTPEPLRLGHADTVVASLLIRTEPVQGEGEQFTLRLWSTADGAVRLRAQKLDVDVLDALVRADGAYDALLVRERVATAGRLGGADDPLLLRDLRLMMSELRDGPLPRGAVATGTAQQLTWPDALGWQAELDLGPDGLPTAKRLRAGEVVVRTIAYARWQTNDGLTRASQVRLHGAAEDGVLAIRVKSLDTPPVISPERMALRIPDDVERVDPVEFTQRMPQ